jgi:hypothetical protein
MAFPTDWGRRCALVIQSSQVGNTETNFPLLVATDSLPSEMKSCYMGKSSKYQQFFKYDNIYLV